MQRFTIPFRLPSLNDYINVCRRNKYQAAKFKAALHAQIAPYVFRLDPIVGCCVVKMTFVEPDRRRDVDNVESAKKYILDTMVACKRLQGDSPKWVRAVPSYTEYGEAAQVEVEIMPVEEWEKNEEGCSELVCPKCGGDNIITTSTWMQFCMNCDWCIGGKKPPDMLKRMIAAAFEDDEEEA